MKIFIHCDICYTDFKKIKKYLKTIDSEIPESDEECQDPQKINTVYIIYGKTIKILESMLSRLNNINIQRRHCNEITDCLRYSDKVVLFHNFTQYGNGMQEIIDCCHNNFIPLTIYFGEKILKLSFKSEKINDIPNILIEDFIKPAYKKKDIKEIVNQVNNMYTRISYEKTARGISIL